MHATLRRPRWVFLGSRVTAICVDALILGEHREHGHLLLEEVHAELDLIIDAAAVDLNLHNVPSSSSGS